MCPISRNMHRPIGQRRLRIESSLWFSLESSTVVFRHFGSEQNLIFWLGFRGCWLRGVKTWTPWSSSVCGCVGVSVCALAFRDLHVLTTQHISSEPASVGLRCRCAANFSKWNQIKAGSSQASVPNPMAWRRKKVSTLRPLHL